MNEIEKAILETLLKNWKEEIVPVKEKGGRLFSRYVDLRDEYFGYSDWSVIGTIVYDEQLVLVSLLHHDEEEWPADEIVATVATGELMGWVEDGPIHVQFAISNHDGPETPRVSEWAKVT